MSYWTVVPTRVRKAKDLSPTEKEFYYLLTDRLTKGGYVKDTNKELAKQLNVATKTIESLLAKLKDKKYIFIRHYDHARRLIFLNIPGEPSDEQKPTEDALQDKTETYLESLKKAIVFGSIDFKVLVEKLLESPYLEKVEDNHNQFVLNLQQICFLAKFSQKFKNKSIDCQLASFPDVDYEALMEHLLVSKFLGESANLSLKWCLENADEIISDKYRDFGKPGFKGRDYSDYDDDEFYVSIEDIAL